MAARDQHPIRRIAREEARVWPVALLLVSLYLFGSDWLAEPNRSETEAGSTSGHWQTKGDEE
ncbi:hypothetical protein [Roseicyclus marinus]|uniref:hypothetical protein n=1 Tax=Roseicyclus marinus TaxID=2161673 RepID=UPI00240F0B16|nr:hypothetical protein [Roseicyclus marinus]MDG3040427.1 hypothetical protein [Roseicyclus marinus]